MDKRTLWLVALLLAPLLVMVSIVAFSPPQGVAMPSGQTLAAPGAKASRNMPSAAVEERGVSLEEARQRLRSELKRLEAMSPQQWEAEQKRRKQPKPVDGNRQAR
jgi:hypothetical protein